MPKNTAIAIIVGAAIVAGIGAAIVFFDKEPTSPDSGDEIDLSLEPTSPDSGDDEDNQGPDSGDDGDNQGPDSGEEDNSPEPTSPDSGDEIDVNGPDSGDEISLNDDLKNRAKGSCNKIAEGSTCIEYIGSFWTTTNAKLNCGASFVAKACPRPALGGCRIGADTPNEIVTWHYSYGGDPYTEVIQYAAASCKALPSGWWIN